MFDAPRRWSSLAPVVAGLVAVIAAGGLAPACSPGSDASGGSSGDTNACAEDCASLAATPVCDPASGACVGCLPGGDSCGEGLFCDPATMVCVSGCSDDSECASPLRCDPTSHVCVSCVDDTQCPDGMVCAGGTCTQGCSAAAPCDGALVCCFGACVDTMSSTLHCGACDAPCPALAHAEAACNSGVCALGPCDDGFVDCNLNPDDGCEWDLATGACACTPGDTMPCYTGPANTEGVGTCAAGVSTCQPSGSLWGPCDSQVVPLFDQCANGLDEDCDGVADNPPDADGDGYTKCEGDCCDTQADGCGNPELVNPGAFEVDANTVDDDCDGSIDNPLAACDSGLASNSSNAMEYASAIDLCKTTVETPADPSQKTWGVIQGWFYKADSTGTPAANSRAIRTGFGGGVTPLFGSSIAVLSTGYAAAQASPNNASPAYKAFQGGQDMATSGPVPSDWLAANANNFPNAPGCPDPQGGTTAHDPIQLKLRVRVPTNASSFDVSTFFYSSEYPEWVCSAFNDFFLALLDSSFVAGAGQVGNPADKNLATYTSAAGASYPVGVNLAFGNTGLFTQCKNGSTGCGGGAIPGNTNTCAGTNQLTGTGFDVTNPPSQFANDPGWCGNSNFAGGGTGWLTTTGNVVPGEVIELRFTTWDTGDQWYDSVVLLDNFHWSVNASTPGTHQ